MTHGAVDVSFWTMPRKGLLADAASQLGTGYDGAGARKQINVGSLNSGRQPAHRDGDLPTSRFRMPMGIARMSGGRGLVVADTGNNAIREIVLADEGAVRTLEGGRWLRPTDIVTSPDGYVICDSGHHRIALLSFSGKASSVLAGCGKMGYLDGPAHAARFHAQHGICQGPKGSLIIADTGNHVIRMLSKGIVTTIAGQPGVSGCLDGQASDALLNAPMRVVVTMGGSLVIADNNGGLRVMHDDWSYLQTLVPPSAAGEPKHRDGPLHRARMSVCDGMCLSMEGSVVLSDSANHCLRVIDPLLLSLTTLAGSVLGESGAADGVARSCLLNRPCGLCVLNDGSIMLTDAANNTLRVISFDSAARDRPPHQRPNATRTRPSSTRSGDGRGMAPVSTGRSLEKRNRRENAGSRRERESALQREEVRQYEEARRETRARQESGGVHAMARHQEQFGESAEETLPRSVVGAGQREGYSPMPGSLPANPFILETSEEENASVGPSAGRSSSPVSQKATSEDEGSPRQRQKTPDRSMQGYSASIPGRASSSRPVSGQSTARIRDSTWREASLSASDSSSSSGRRSYNSLAEAAEGRRVASRGAGGEGRAAKGVAAYAESLLSEWDNSRMRGREAPKLSAKNGMEMGDYDEQTFSWNGKLEQDGAGDFGGHLPECDLVTSDSEDEPARSPPEPSVQDGAISLSYVTRQRQRERERCRLGVRGGRVRVTPHAAQQACQSAESRAGAGQLRRVHWALKASSPQSKEAQRWMGGGVSDQEEQEEEKNGGWEVEDVEEQAGVLLGGVDEALRGGFLYLARDRLVLARSTLQLGRGSGAAVLWRRVRQLARQLRDLGVQNLTFPEDASDDDLPERAGKAAAMPPTPFPRAHRPEMKPPPPQASREMETVRSPTLSPPRPPARQHRKGSPQSTAAPTPQSILRAPVPASAKRAKDDRRRARTLEEDVRVGGGDDSVMERLSVADLCEMDDDGRRGGREGGDGADGGEEWLSPLYSSAARVRCARDAAWAGDGDQQRQKEEIRHQEQERRKQVMLNRLISARKGPPLAPADANASIWARGMGGSDQSLARSPGAHVSEDEQREEDIVLALQESLHWRQTIDRISRALPEYEQSLMEAACRHISSRQTSPDGDRDSPVGSVGGRDGNKMTGCGRNQHDHVTELRHQIAQLLSSIERRMPASKGAAESSAADAAVAQAAMAQGSPPAASSGVPSPSASPPHPHPHPLTPYSEDSAVGSERSGRPDRGMSLENADSGMLSPLASLRGQGRERSPTRRQQQPDRERDQDREPGAQGTYRLSEWHGTQLSMQADKDEEAEVLLGMGLIGSRTTGAEGSTMRADSVFAEMRNVLDYYRGLTACLAPHRTLCEWQLADWRGTAATCDGIERFLVLHGSEVWVRLSLWGHEYQAIKVSSSDDRLTVSGGIRFDGDKKASYVMLRLRASSALSKQPQRAHELDQLHAAARAGCCENLIAVARCLEEQEAVEWYSRLPDVSVDLRVEAQVSVSGGGGTSRGCAVSLVPDVRLKLTLASSQADIDTHAPHIRVCRRRCLQALPTCLQPIALLSVRAPVRTAVLDQITC